jgi:predicted nucleic acid-binding protein
MTLLDVNVWLAASWARHRHHEVARNGSISKRTSSPFIV